MFYDCMDWSFASFGSLSGVRLDLYIWIFNIIRMHAVIINKGYHHNHVYRNQPYRSPRSINSIARLNVSGSSACRLPSISRRHSRRRPSTAWYCGDSEPKVFRAFARLADILTRGWLDWEHMEAWGVEYFEEGLVVVRSRACHFEAQTGREQAVE